MLEDTGDDASDFVFAAECPSRLILDQIANKWSLLIMAILEKPLRFNAIKRRLEGITQRVLTQTLRKLERNGMLDRAVISGRILAVEYSLTPLGRLLREPFLALFEWTIANMAHIQERQRLFDLRYSGDGEPRMPQTD